jgi:hypothetical protein
MAHPRWRNSDLLCATKPLQHLAPLCLENPHALTQNVKLAHERLWSRSSNCDLIFRILYAGAQRRRLAIYECVEKRPLLAELVLRIPEVRAHEAIDAGLTVSSTSSASAL